MSISAAISARKGLTLLSRISPRSLPRCNGVCVRVVQWCVCIVRMRFTITLAVSPVGSCCPPMTNDECSMLSPLTWMPGRCVAIRVRRTFANEPLPTTCVINARHPRSRCVGGTPAKMRLPQSAGTTSLTGVVSSWRGRASATRCRHGLLQMVPLSPPPALGAAAATRRRKRQWRRRQRRRSILLDSTEP